MCAAIATGKLYACTNERAVYFRHKPISYPDPPFRGLHHRYTMPIQILRALVEELWLHTHLQLRKVGLVRWYETKSHYGCLIWGGGGGGGRGAFLHGDTIEQEKKLKVLTHNSH